MIEFIGGIALMVGGFVLLSIAFISLGTTCRGDRSELSFLILVVISIIWIVTGIYFCGMDIWRNIIW